MYILYSTRIDRYYTGSSDNPETRNWFHSHTNQGWTVRGQPWELVFTKAFPSKAEAQWWERWIKRQKSRRIIEKILRGDFVWERR
ncbi:MAG: GIY-YIG nuclease family protein [Candidatus Marinimicrobia bacterium]|nr:GIY-YIG nuclease family protein [Candidatus Neomarinimicrobiota bacterium]MCF7828681.1 GIY-YIG nuclease family protein [Candidatus Neomarinimicrobiota bacterium]MCF7880422.1 GIY-YIG nuclease family protein [Candidatus Neomarinimicrobiota bacterium]